MLSMLAILAVLAMLAEIIVPAGLLAALLVVYAYTSNDCTPSSYEYYHRELFPQNVVSSVWSCLKLLFKNKWAQ